MSVHIFRNHLETSYDMTRPIEEQVYGSDRVLIDYQDNDSSVEHFLNEIEKISKTSFGFGLNIEVINNSFIGGARAKNKVLLAAENMNINDIIGLMVKIHFDTDMRLSELAQMCMGESNNE